MITVKNQKVISEVAKTTYGGNKKRNLLTIIAICLTTFLITVVIALGFRYWNTISTRQVQVNGMDYDIELSEPRADQVKKIRSMDSVKDAGVAVKCAMMESYQNITLEKIRMFWIDDICWEKQCIPALDYYEGAYPEKENEIMLSNSALNAMGITKPELGMSIVLEYYTLNENNASQETLQKEFVLSGYYKDYSGSNRAYVSKDFFEETGVKQTDYTQGSLKITLKNPLYSKEDIVKLQNVIDLDHNQIISADYDTISSFCKMTMGLAGMLAMIFLSGYLFIYNTLSISITKDIRYYGQLKTIGMTSKQLKSMIYKQSLWNSYAGIPIGLLLGIAAANGIIPQIIHIANPTLAVNDIVTASPWIYFIASLFAFATNMISSKKPASIVAQCSPIEAMRYLPASRGRKKRKTMNGSLSSMAIQNIFRDKKQASIIFLSFVIAVSLFFIVNVVIKENDAKSVLNTIYSYDILFQNETILEDDESLITDDQIKEIRNTEGIKNVGVVSSTEVVIPYQEEVYGTFFRKLYESRFSPGNYEKDLTEYKENPENKFFTSRFIGIDENEFNQLDGSMGGVLDKEKFEKGEIAVTVNFFMNGEDEGMSGKTVNFYFPGDEQTTHTIMIAAVVPGSLNPAYFSGGYAPELIVSEQYAKKLLEETTTELIHITYDQAFSKSTEAKVKKIFTDVDQISYDSKLDRYSDMKKTETQVKILGNSIGIIMASLAVLNYFNMMAASIQSRLQEFATLESIGMTSKQLRRVLAYEGAGYAAISLALSLLVGTPLSYLVFQSMNLYGMEYVIPWISNVVLIVVTGILCMVVPVWIYWKTQSGSIVEKLREVYN